MATDKSYHRKVISLMSFRSPSGLLIWSSNFKIKISSLDFWATLSRIRSDKAANYQRSPAELSRSRPGKRKHDVPTRKNHFFSRNFFKNKISVIFFPEDWRIFWALSVLDQTRVTSGFAKNEFGSWCLSMNPFQW